MNVKSCYNGQVYYVKLPTGISIEENKKRMGEFWSLLPAGGLMVDMYGSEEFVRACTYDATSLSIGWFRAVPMPESEDHMIVSTDRPGVKGAFFGMMVKKF